MSDATLWWIAAGIAVAVELGTGTFYLLMLALGLSAAGLAAHLGLASSLQLVTAAVVGGGAVTAWHLWRLKHHAAPPAQSNRDVNLDIGSGVQVEHWDADGTARVTYRGAAWSARHTGAGAPQPGRHVIRSIEGSELLLERSDQH